MSSQQPPIYYFLNIGFNSANWSSMTQGGLSQALADQYYLGRIGTPTSIATNTTFTGTTDINGVKTPTIESKTGTVSCTSNLTLSNTTATLNNMICNNKGNLRATINPLIYANASLGRQMIIVAQSGTGLTNSGGPTVELSFTPTGSSLEGTLTWPANTISRGDTFKYTMAGQYIRGTNAQNPLNPGIINYKFYLYNINLNNYTSLITLEDSTNVAVGKFYNEVILLIRTDPGVSTQLTASGMSITGGPSNFQPYAQSNATVTFNATQNYRIHVTCTVSIADGLNQIQCNVQNYQSM